MGGKESWENITIQIEYAADLYVIYPVNPLTAGVAYVRVYIFY